MLVSLYYLPLCPRCRAAKARLRGFLGEKFEEQIVFVDAAKHPIKTWQEGVRIVPALKCHDDLISGFFLTQAQILRFLVKHGIPHQQGGASE